MQSILTKLNEKDLILSFERLITLEKRTTAEIIEYLREIDRRKLFLELGHTSLFSYLTKGLGYSESSALRRIDAARMLNSVPEIKQELEFGHLNLTQVSLVAQGIRQKEKENKSKFIKGETPDKKTLLMKVKNLDTASTQKVVAESLDLKIQVFDKKTVQKDESIRIQITLTAAQMKNLERVKELISHTYPNPNTAELINFLSLEFLKKKDPLLKTSTPAVSITDRLSGSASSEPQSEDGTTAPVVKNDAIRLQVDAKPCVTATNSTKPRSRTKLLRRHIPIGIQRAIFQRDRCCQWIDPQSKRKCCSRFQMQIDHILSWHKGGGNESDNLQILCGVHNRLKYCKESSAAD